MYYICRITLKFKTMEDINFDLYWSQQLDAHLEDDYFEIDADYDYERLNDK